MIVVAKKRYLCCNCSSVGCLKCVLISSSTVSMSKKVQTETGLSLFYVHIRSTYHVAL